MEKPIRLHPPTVSGVITALQEIFEKNQHAHIVVGKLLSENKKWGSRDRAFVANSTYEIVRHWRKLWAIFGKDAYVTKKSMYQIFGIWWLSEGNALPDWNEFESLKEFDVEKALADLPQTVGVQESFPDWLDKMASEQLGEAWPVIAKSLNLPAPLSIRVNMLHLNQTKLAQLLNKEEVKTRVTSVSSSALIVEGRKKITNLKLYNKGLFEIQDAGSQLIAPFVQAKPGQNVIDACAGAGGKTLHLAALMKNSGQIIAMDIYPEKLKECNIRANRNGVSIVRTEELYEETLTDYQEFADAMLLDVPCSGTGVLKRDVDNKWKMKPEDVEDVIALQRQILSTYTCMLKPGGTFVYATCSILPSENENQTKWFIENYGSQFELDAEKRLNPSADNDGFYMARFKKL